MREKLNELLRRLLAINRRILIVATAGLGGLLVIGLIGLSTISSTSFSLLYGGLSNEDSRQIIRLLDRNNISFSTRSEGAEVLVPSEDVVDVRILLAEEGLPTKGTVGYELFDDQSAIGASNLVQEVNRLRSLEGEISRTITSMAKIQSARVHIVLPRRELFSREQQPPSASVVIKTIGGQRLDRGQVQSIVHVVAAAVPRLQTDSITVADDRGELLARGDSESLNQFGGRTPDEVRLDYETRVARRLEAILENVVGQDKVRAEVRAEIDFSQTVINEEEFDPESQVVRSEETIEETNFRSISPEDAVTVQNNIPENELLTQGQVNETENSSRSEERINYEISRVETNQIIPPGRLDRLSVAVLVDGVYSRGVIPNRLEYQPRSEEEITQIERLVKSAIGYDALNRNDVVEIVNLPFSTSNIVGTEEEPLIFGLPASDFRDIVEQVVLAIVILLILFWVVRPLVMRFVGDSRDEFITRIGPDGRPQLVNRKTGEPVKALPAGTAGAADADGTLPALAGSSGDGTMTEDEYVQLLNLRSRIKGNISRQLNSLIEKYPDEATALLREWLSQK